MVDKIISDLLKSIRDVHSLNTLEALGNNQGGMSFSMIGKHLGYKHWSEQRKAGLSYMMRKLRKAGLVTKKHVEVSTYAEFDVYVLTNLGKRLADIIDVMQHEFVEDKEKIVNETD
tara:strand:+ start:266 stop:613 length:348 start_codon:yes stop_codon:yes gene_type:complete